MSIAESEPSEQLFFILKPAAEDLDYSILPFSPFNQNKEKEEKKIKKKVKKIINPLAKPFSFPPSFLSASP